MISLQAKKKILFISTKSVLGGAQRYILDLIDYLPKDAFVFEVASGGQGPLGKKVTERGVLYHPLKGLGRDIHPALDLVSFWQMLKLITKRKPDILHLSSSKASFLGAVIGRIARVPKIVSSSHGWPFLEDRPSWQKKTIRLLVKLGLHFQDAAICVSHFDYEIATQYKIAPRKKLVQIHNGIDPKRNIFIDKHEAREKLFRMAGIHTKNAFLIGTIAEYTKNKGLYYLIEAASQIIHVEPNAIFILVGWGEDKQFLERQIEIRGLKHHVFLLEFLPDAFTYLKAFDVFVLPSLKEGFAYALLEAALAETPIIATRVGGNPEIVENFKTGLMIKPISPEEIINAISHLIRYPKQRAEFGRAAREKVLRDFSIQSMVNLTRSVYDS